ncbi:MAG: sigma-70 family RNA polymerase sigma factor [Phycisphaeraceae bacterium]
MPTDPQPSDEQLVASIRGRDAEALGGLFDRYAPTMLALGRRMLGPGSGEAEDVLSEVFWEVWDKPDRYDARRGSVKSYLMLVMRSRCLDRLRSRKARPDRQGLPLQADRHADNGLAPDAAAQRDEAREQVRQAVDALDTDQRRAIELSFYQGLSHREIAEQLDAPLGTIKGRLRSGLIKLSRALRKKGDVTL